MISMANIREIHFFCNSKDKIAYPSDKIACSEYLMKQKKKNSHAVCDGLFSPYKMRGGYFSS
jgi:hypothetical protein